MNTVLNNHMIPMIFVDAVTMTFLWCLGGIEVSTLVFLKTGYFHYAGKLKNKKVKNDKLQTTEAPQYEKTETVDQIKKRYGYTTTSSVSIHLFMWFMVSAVDVDL